MERVKVPDVEYSDSDYSINMRVDPLTTMDQIKSEIQELEKNSNQREAEKIKAEKQKADEEAKELQELRAFKRANANKTPENPSPHPGSGVEDPR